MIGILLSKFKLFIRTPWVFIFMTILSISFALILGMGNASTIQIPIHTEYKEIRESIIGDLLDDSDVFHFKWMEKEDVLNKISNGKAELGVILKEDDFEIITGVSSFYLPLVKQTVKEAYLKKAEHEQIANLANSSEEKEQLKQDLGNLDSLAAFSIELENFRGKDAWVYDDQLQKIFGLTLFFVIYTVAYNVVNILVEKQTGIWDRMILSPLRKWEMYAGNLIYSFITGYFQAVVIFIIFRFGFGIDFNGKLIHIFLLLIPYVFAIVSLSILITSIVKSMQQFNAIIPFIAVGMAMIGGAFWPIELVESKPMLLLANIMPIKYGMELLHGVAVYGYSFSELLYPMSMLLLMGVLLMGIAIHLMERRHV